jgi:hypothetical protein
MVVDVTPYWREALVLWQALVGAPSTGKTAALVAGRRLLGSVKAPPDPPDDEKNPRRGETKWTRWTMNRGFSTWYEDLDAALVEASRDREERFYAIGAWTGEASHSLDGPFDVGRRPARVAASFFGAVQADRLAETLSGVDDGLLSRFLYCWPMPRLEARLDRDDGGFESARRLLQRLLDLPGRIAQPAALTLQAAAADHLEALLPRLRAFMRDADGVEAAWIGKAAGTIVRLAGLLCLMDWAAGDATEPCRTIEEQHLERAHALWSEYFWPHAQAVFGEAPSTLDERRVRRVGRWLRRMRPQTVSREEVRREALCQTVDADTAESVIERLERDGVLRLLPVMKESRSGPRKLRWEVNQGLWAS